MVAFRAVGNFTIDGLYDSSWDSITPNVWCVSIDDAVKTRNELRVCALGATVQDVTRRQLSAAQLVSGPCPYSPYVSATVKVVFGPSHRHLGDVLAPRFWKAFVTEVSTVNEWCPSHVHDDHEFEHGNARASTS